MVNFLTTIAVVLLAYSNLMTCCKISKQEKRIKQEIKKERSQLNRIQQYRRDLEQSYSQMSLDAHRCLNMLGQGIGLLKRLLEEEEES